MEIDECVRQLMKLFVTLSYVICPAWLHILQVRRVRYKEVKRLPRARRGWPGVWGQARACLVDSVLPSITRDHCFSAVGAGVAALEPSISEVSPGDGEWGPVCTVLPLQLWESLEFRESMIVFHQT